jgi:hypothetical protein
VKLISFILCALFCIAPHATAQEQSIDRAIASGLSYLADQQNADGSFASRDQKLATTGLTLLAFLSTGNTADGGRYATNVRRATDYLLRQAPSDRNFGRADGSGASGQAIITLALCREYGVEPDEPTRLRIRAILKDAVTILLMEPNGSHWTLDVLRAAERIGIQVPKESFDRIATSVEKAPTSQPTTDLLANQSEDGGWPDDTSADARTRTTALAILTLARKLRL